MKPEEIEKIIADAENDAETFWGQGGDWEIEHSEADKTVAKLLLAVCAPKYRDRVAKIVEKYTAENGWHCA